MVRSIALIVLSLALLATLAGCIVVDDHGHKHGRGGHLPPGQLKKMR